MFQIDLKSRKSIYQQVVDNMKELIMCDILPPGTKLPSVRELSKQLVINPNTVSKAYKELERQGFIYTQTGLGTFAAEPPASGIDRAKLAEIEERISLSISELYFMGLGDEEIRKTIERLIRKRGESDD